MNFFIENLSFHRIQVRMISRYYVFPIILFFISYTQRNPKKIAYCQWTIFLDK
jgi:hypothetical protein